MTNSVRPIPEGYHSVTPYLIVSDAAGAIAFYKEAFGAKEIMRMAAPGGRVGHAELKIGDSRIMLADEFPDMGARSPRAIGGTPVSLHLYVEDVDAVAKRAVAAGAKEVRPVKDQFYGDRLGTVEDPFGHLWHVSTHKEDLSPDELKRRAEKTMGQAGS
jgi:PhnB protein